MIATQTGFDGIMDEDCTSKGGIKGNSGENHDEHHVPDSLGSDHPEGDSDTGMRRGWAAYHCARSCSSQRAPEREEIML